MNAKYEERGAQSPARELSGAQATGANGLDCPSLDQIFPESAQLPPALEPPKPALFLPLHEQEALLRSVNDALGKAELKCDTAAFESVPDVLSRLWNCRSKYLVQATEALANGSRNPPFRLVYGQAEILSFFLRLIASKEATESNLILHSLRLIGNSCADTDENRATVVKDNYTFAIMRYLLRPELIQVVIPVIYNLCIDYEPAQSQLAANKIVYILLRLLKDDAFGNNASLLDYVYELIELVGEQEQGIGNSPDGTIPLLIALALNKDVVSTPAQFCCLATCLAAHLENKRFQELCVSKQMVSDIPSVLKHSLSFSSGISSSEDAQALAQSQIKINQALAEISASPLFAEHYPLDSPLSQTLKSWLTTTEDQLQISACVMLGNLARSDEVCEAMVKELKIHEELIAVLKNKTARGAVLHSALGFLKNLAIASDNKLYLGKAGIIPAISRLWGYESVPQVQLAATSIARQLIISSAENISLLLENVSTEDNQSESGNRETTYLSLLLALFEKSDSTPIKTEIGRIVASISRTLVPAASRDQDANKELLNRLFSYHEGVARPVGAMITQTQWPVVRSEAWFTLALMSSSKAGHSAVVHCLQEIDGFALIERTLTVEDDAGDNETDKVQLSKDRVNMVILVQELLRNDRDAPAAPWKERMRNLMNSQVQKYLKQSEAGVSG